MIEYLRSAQGVRFTATSVGAVEAMQKEVADAGHVLVAVICRDEQDDIDVNFAGDYEPQPRAISDQLGEAIFYWYADLEQLIMLRAHAVEASLQAKTKVLRPT